MVLNDDKDEASIREYRAVLNREKTRYQIETLKNYSAIDERDETPQVHSAAVSDDADDEACSLMTHIL